MCHHHVPSSAVRKGEWKLIENLVDGQISLYHLPSDIIEQMDLSVLYPSKKDELYRELKRWESDVKAEFPVRNSAFYPEKRHEWGRHPDRMN